MKSASEMRAAQARLKIQKNSSTRKNNACYSVNRRAVVNLRAKDATPFEAIQHAPDDLALMNQSAFYAALAVSSCSSALCPAYNADDLSLVDDGKAFDSAGLVMT